MNDSIIIINIFLYYSHYVIGALLLILLGIVFPYKFACNNSFSSDNEGLSPGLFFVCNIVFVCVYYTLFLILMDGRNLIGGFGSIIGLIILLLVYGLVFKHLIYSAFSNGANTWNKTALLINLIGILIYTIWLWFCWGLFGWADGFSDHDYFIDNLSEVIHLFAILPILVLPILMLIDKIKYKIKKD